MKLSLIALSLVTVCVVGCSSNQQYSTVKTGPDRFAVSGPDPNQLQGNAFKACKDEGFDDYSVVEAQKERMVVRCEKTPKSFVDSASETATKAWDTVKKKVDELRASASTTK
jgi:hypothetical protein